MPDITKCVNENCPLKMECYRFNSLPSLYHQSYSLFSPNKDGKCDFFYEIKITK